MRRRLLAAAAGAEAAAAEARWRLAPWSTRYVGRGNDHADVTVIGRLTAAAGQAAARMATQAQARECRVCESNERT